MREHFYRPNIVANTLRLRSVKQALAQAGLIDFNLEQFIDEVLKNR